MCGGLLHSLAVICDCVSDVRANHYSPNPVSILMIYDVWAYVYDSQAHRKATKLPAKVVLYPYCKFFVFPNVEALLLRLSRKFWCALKWASSANQAMSPTTWHIRYSPYICASQLSTPKQNTEKLQTTIWDVKWLSIRGQHLPFPISEALVYNSAVTQNCFTLEGNSSIG
jgi:hypothetical protein